MKVRDLDVTQVNSKYIFAKDNVRVKTTKQFLDDIIVTAQENVLFYSRMFQEVKEQGDKLIAEVEAKHPYIDDESIKHMGLLERIDAELQNEYRQRELHAAYGFREGMTYALARQEEAYKLFNQASVAMKEVA